MTAPTQVTLISTDGVQELWQCNGDPNTPAPITGFPAVQAGTSFANVIISDENSVSNGLAVLTLRSGTTGTISQWV